MTDLVRRDDLWEAYQQMEEPTRKGIRELIRNAPAVDAVPVVRCKDCKHWHEDIGETTAWLMCHEIVTDRDWFCASGERREEDGADA